MENNTICNCAIKMKYHLTTKKKKMDTALMVLICP